MRVVRLILLGLLAFVVTGVVLFPAAPVVDRIRPQLGPVALEGVSGPLIAGNVARVRSTDDLLPLEFDDVGWSLAPLALPRGAAADITFSGYGGGGAGQVLRAWNGDIRVEDLTFTAESKALEPLLPVPIASFSGTLAGDLAEVVLVNELLTTLNGTLSWTDAVLETPIRAAFGTVDVDVAKSGEDAHVITLGARGGDVVTCLWRLHHLGHKHSKFAFIQSGRDQQLCVTRSLRCAAAGGCGAISEAYKVRDRPWGFHSRRPGCGRRSRRRC